MAHVRLMDDKKGNKLSNKTIPHIKIEEIEENVKDEIDSNDILGDTP
jgi:hypothetical protein